MDRRQRRRYGTDSVLPVDFGEISVLVQEVARAERRAGIAEGECRRAGIPNPRDARRRPLNVSVLGCPTCRVNATVPVQEQLHTEIEAVSGGLPGYLLTLPSNDAIRAVSLFGETDPIATFKGPEQLVAFAGLELTMFQTGQYEAPRRKISKRGSPHLRRTLWTMAAMAIRAKGDLRRFYQKKRKRGSHHLSAVTATAIKVPRAVWRVCTDQRDYLPKAPPKSIPA